MTQSRRCSRALVARWLALVLPSTMAAALAQEPPKQEPAPTRRASEPTMPERTQERLRRDLRRCAEQLASQPTSFTGQWHRFDLSTPEPVQSVPFVVAQDGALHYLRIGEFVVLGCGDERRSHRDGAWKRPEGDEPEWPLRLADLLHAAESATLSNSLALAIDDRPAQAVHLTWHGEAAVALLARLWAPAPEWQRALENLTDDFAKIAPAEPTVDAVLSYEPATKQPLRATLRFAVLPPADLVTTGDPPRCPPLLPPLRCRPLLQFQYDLLVVPKVDPAWPAVDSALRASLASTLPAATPSAPPQPKPADPAPDRR
jgi:hypothetical protein